MESNSKSENFYYKRPQNICICNFVSEETIIKAIEKGCDTLEKISAETNACTDCKSCKPRILEILKRTKGES